MPSKALSGKVIMLVMVMAMLGGAVLLTGSIVFAHGNVDQSQITQTATLLTISFASPTGQEFTPSNPTLLGVDINVAPANPGFGDDTLTVNIRKGTITAPILATTSQVVAASFSGLAHFDLPAPLSVTPGDVYVLEVQASKLTHGWFHGNVCPDGLCVSVYPGGAAIIFGSVVSITDFSFQTYSRRAAFTVNSTADAVDATPGDGACDDGAGNCTLRAAIMEANALPGADTITLPAGTYILSISGRGEDAAQTGDLDITDDLTINGAGAAVTIVDGGTVDRVFHVFSGITAEISGVTTRNGSAASFGGGIFNDGTLVLAESAVSGNMVKEGFGAGIYNGGVLNITNSTIDNNTIPDVPTCEGGGIYNRGTLTLVNSTVSGNRVGGDREGRGIGGGIRNIGTVILASSTVDGNRAGQGGGIRNSGTITITKSTVSGNTGTNGAGIKNSGTVTLTESTVSGNITPSNEGGGIWNNGTLSLTRSIVTGNHAGRVGGGILNSGTLTLTNSTVSGNSVIGRLGGGGILTWGGTVTLVNSTVSGNSGVNGGGIANVGAAITLNNVTVSGNTASSSGGGLSSSGTVVLANTIIAGNVATTDPDCSGTTPITSSGFNLIGDATGCGFTGAPGDLVGTATSPIDPLLGPLQDNGGPTFTHALLPGSPAIDAGNPVTPSSGGTACEATDQRGVSRPQGLACDIGAYELEVPNLPPTADAGGPYIVDEGTSVIVIGSGVDPDGDPITFDWDLDNDGTFETPGQSVTFSASGLDGPSSHTIGLQVTDSFGLSATAQATVNVLNVAPTVGQITAPVVPLEVGSTPGAIASFTDPGVPDTHTAAWDWGDDTTSPGTISECPHCREGVRVVTGSHTYTAAGVYTVTLTVTDDDGGSGQSVFTFVVVFDPSEGFVTGGGWMDSPLGAYAPDPSLAGKANFGFVSKYQRGATVPTGQTEFRFRVADLDFHSTEYEWLVVGGPKAQFKGSGTINGSGDFGFILTANDGQINGGGGVDKFRIKIVDKDTDTVIYDNQPGDADDGDATTVLEGGSIVIQAK